MINEHLSSFAGLPIYSIEIEDPEDETLEDEAAEDDAPEDVSQVAWRIALDYDTPEEEFDRALDTVLERTGPGGPAAWCSARGVSRTSAGLRCSC